jgi:hypothetical protein
MRGRALLRNDLSGRTRRRRLRGRKAFIVPALAAWTAVLFPGCSSGSKLYTSDPDAELVDYGSTVCLMPLDSVEIQYSDNTRANPDTLFSDSFFLAAANDLLTYEMKKRFTFRSSSEHAQELARLADTVRALGFSRVGHGNADRQEATSALMRKAARTSGCDLVAVAFSCRLKHVAYQPPGWRGGGPSYERPVSYRAYGRMHVQIWNKNGVLLHEGMGADDTGRPVLYSLFGKKKPENDIVKYAKRLYAPPLVRALYLSIQDAVRIRG